MNLRDDVIECDIEEAIRLFQVSTIKSVKNISIGGFENILLSNYESKDFMRDIEQIERQLKRRFGIGNCVSEHAIFNDFIKQNFQVIFSWEPAL